VHINQGTSVAFLQNFLAQDGRLGIDIFEETCLSSEALWIETWDGDGTEMVCLALVLMPVPVDRYSRDMLV
jgi:hypothetical protein